MSDPSRFRRDTAVRPLGDGRYEAVLDRGWWIVAGPNGGYVAAVVARAVEAAVADPSRSIRSLTLHYLRPPGAGAAVVEVESVRSGRSVGTLAVRMVQDGRLLLVGLVTVAGSFDGPVAFDDVVAPVAPPPEEVPPLPPAADGGIPMHRRYEMRPCFGTAPWIAGPAEAAPPAAVSGGWIRLAEPTSVDHVVLAALTDAWWPPLFARVGGVPMAVPTVDLTIHLRALPSDPSDWVLARFESPLAADGFLVEDGTLHDRHGRLLAQSRQLAVLR